jgi:hypothetical protein
MALIALPTRFGFTRVENFGLRRAGVSLRSRYTGQAQRITYPFAIWEFAGNFIDYPEDQGAREIRGFLVALEGQKNNFDLPVPGYKQNSANLGNGNLPVITVNAAARATQVTFNMSFGFGALLDYLKVGEYFTINNELKIVTVNSTAGGVVQFQPPLRAPAVIGNIMTVVNPYCRMIAEENDVAKWGIGAPTKHGFKLEAIEDI